VTALHWLGLLGGSLFAYAAVPQAIRTIRAGRHLGVPLDIALAIFGGTLVMYAYLHASHGFDWVIAVNYAVEAASWGVLLFYRLRPEAQEATRRIKGDDPS
jgi:hypothetical protein